MKVIRSALRAHFTAIGRLSGRDDFAEFISRYTANDSGPVTVEGAMFHLEEAQVPLWGDREKVRTAIARTALKGDTARVARDTYALHVRDDLVRIVTVR